MFERLDINKSNKILRFTQHTKNPVKSAAKHLEKQDYNLKMTMKGFFVCEAYFMFFKIPKHLY